MQNTNNIILYKNIEQNNGEIIEGLDWSRKNNNNFCSIHSVASYLAMFSPSLPKYFIEKYSTKNSIVMDNFSGRGTTALVSREFGRKFIGSDLNPYAIVLSKLKISTINKKVLFEKIKILQNEFNLNKECFINKTKEKKFIELNYFYSKKTLSQLIFLREKIGSRWRELDEIENGIIAFALGIMHGPSKKDGSTIYFSLTMPNTISMSPNYVKEYAIKNNLKKPNLDVFQLIINRVESKFSELLSEKFEGSIYEHDATMENNDIKKKSVSLIITSPPYLNIVNYKTSNWLKLWLLGYNRNQLNYEIKLSDNLKFNEYVFFIKKYLISVYDKLENNAKVCLVVGDVLGMPLIENVWKLIKNEVNYKFVEIYCDFNYKQNCKITNMMNQRKGKATIIEKVLVLSKKDIKDKDE